MAELKQTMSAQEIVSNHIANNGIDSTPEETIAQIKATIEQNKNARLVRVGDCLFVIKINGTEGLFYILNGGGGLSYLKAVRDFVEGCRKAGLTTLKMYVSNTDTAEQIAKMVGATNVSFEMDESRDVDPYLMTLEI